MMIDPAIDSPKSWCIVKTLIYMLIGVVNPLRWFQRQPAIRPQNHPFPFLLYMEWVLLGASCLIELLPGLPRFSHSPWPSPISIIGFTIMGLWLPLGKLRIQLIYTGVEVIWIGLGALLGNFRLFPFLYVPLVIRSCLMYRIRGQIVVSAIACILFQISLFRRFQRAIPFAVEVVPGQLEPGQLEFIGFMFTLLFALSLVFLLLLINTLLAERQSREQLAAANTQLRHYALQIETLATAQERNRIAREIHDSLGHALTALNIQLEGAIKLWTLQPERAHDFIQEAKRLGSKALQEVRQSVTALRSDPLEGQSLRDGIQTLAQEFHSMTGIQPVCTLDMDPDVVLPGEISISLYRIVQESLTNICKYAQASQVSIQMMQERNGSQSWLRLQVEDNGQGFNPDQNTMGFGIQGMRERTLAIGGSFRIWSQIHAGSRIQVEIPLPDPFH